MEGQCCVAAGGDLLSGGVVTTLPMAWKRKPVLCQLPERTWHSRVADGETKAQGVTQLELLVAMAPRRGLPWTHKESQGQNLCLNHHLALCLPRQHAACWDSRSV